MISLHYHPLNVSILHPSHNLASQHFHLDHQHELHAGVEIIGVAEHILLSVAANWCIFRSSTTSSAKYRNQHKTHICHFDALLGHNADKTAQMEVSLYFWAHFPKDHKNVLIQVACAFKH